MTIERLRAAHQVDKFSSGNGDLDRWLHDAAMNADRAGTARVYVSVPHPGRVEGYFAVLPHSVRRSDIPPGVGRGAPDLIPGFLLGRLAVDAALHGRGRGGELLVLALEKILDAIVIGGGRVIVVDAVDEHAAEFYRRYGFEATPNDPARLVMKASRVAASIGYGWP